MGKSRQFAPMHLGPLGPVPGAIPPFRADSESGRELSRLPGTGAWPRPPRHERAAPSREHRLRSRIDEGKDPGAPLQVRVEQHPARRSRPEVTQQRQVQSRSMCHRWYHISHMEKTTVYLPVELKRSLRRLAVASGRSEADLIRQAIAAQVHTTQQPRPRGQLFASGDSSLSERTDEALAGFGDR